MRRPVLALLLALLAPLLQAQTAPADSLVALSFTRSYPLPQARARIFDDALAVWKMTFGREPSARLERTDRDAGVLEGTARFNYRSIPLTAREETMGVITYRVLLQAANGECRVHISALKHTGNHSSSRGGIDFGPLVVGPRPVAPVPGMGARNAERIFADQKAQVSTHLEELLRNFGTLLRQAAEQ